MLFNKKGLSRKRALKKGYILIYTLIIGSLVLTLITCMIKFTEDKMARDIENRKYVLSDIGDDSKYIELVFQNTRENINLILKSLSKDISKDNIKGAVIANGKKYLNTDLYLIGTIKLKEKDCLVLFNSTENNFIVKYNLDKKFYKSCIYNYQIIGNKIKYTYFSTIYSDK